MNVAIFGGFSFEMPLELLGPRLSLTYPSSIILGMMYLCDESFRAYVTRGGIVRIPRMSTILSDEAY